MHPMHQIYFYLFLWMQHCKSISTHASQYKCLANIPFLWKYSEKSIAYSTATVFQLTKEHIFCETHGRFKTFWHIFLTQKLLSEEDFMLTDYITVMVWEKYDNLHTLGTRHLCPVYDLRHNCEYSSRDVVKKSFKA